MDPLGAQTMVRDLWFQALNSRLLKFGFAFNLFWNKKVFDSFLFHKEFTVKGLWKIREIFGALERLDILGRFLVM